MEINTRRSKIMIVGKEKKALAQSIQVQVVIKGLEVAESFK